jgi:hypothetical protein
LLLGSEISAQHTCPKYDFLHPKNFVIISETAAVSETSDSEDGPPDRRILWAESPTDSTRIVHEVFDPEVDADSRVKIEFDRQWILKQEGCFEAEILITASKRGRNRESAPIEVLGYSSIGKEKTPASARIRSAHELIHVLTEVSLISGLLHDILNRPGISIREAQEVFEDSSMWQTVIPPMVHLIGERQNRWAVPLERLEKDEFNREVRALGLNQGREPAVVQQSARDILGWMEKLKSHQNVSSSSSIQELQPAAQIIKGLFDTIWELASLLEPCDLDYEGDPYDCENVRKQRAELASVLLGDLKDASIYVPTNANSGDQIVIRIQNGPTTQDLYREHELVLRVSEFGWTREISDSFMFVKRTNVSEPELNENGVSETQPTGMGNDTAGEQVAESSVEFPREVNFEPAAGASLSWIYRARKDEPGFLQWLTPALGVNVLFPRFGSTVVTFTPATSPDSLSQLEFTESDKDLEVATGLVASLFDNSVHFTLGWNLNVSEKRRYWGVGFSFVEIAKKAKSLVDGK